jgi:acetamidase/formamidase
VPSVLTIRSGDRVRLETMVAQGLWRLRRAGAEERRIPASLVAVEEAVTDRGPGAHPMTGPIQVEGAEPGDVLEIRILEIDYLTPYGVSGFLPAGGSLPDQFPYAGLRFFEFDLEAGTAAMGDSGLSVPLRPFFGSIGVAPPEMRGRISSGPPSYHGGNLDNKELVAGTTLFLPVHVAGANLSIGDGHAAQGDGEVSGTAIETSLTGTVEVLLHKDVRLRWPRAETETHYMSMGLHTDLDEAARIAVLEMVEFLVDRHGISREDAYVLCSVALDLRVTQIVDGTKGIHGMLPKAILEAAAP